MPPVESDALIAGRYRLQARLDFGGAAEVWQGTDEELRRPVALKILITPEGGDPAFVERFRNEAQAEANLKHPNIVEVFDWGHDGETNYVVMEMLAGRSVRQTLDAGGPVPATQVLAVGRQVASAINYAHHAGEAHGRLAPHTIVIAPDGHATVVGFGLWCRDVPACRPASDEDTTALGAVMYEMLTGASPSGPAPAGTDADEPWPRHPRKVAADVPEELDRIVMKAIAPDPAQRYETAAALQADLDALARPKSRAWLWTLVALTAIAVAAFGAWYLASQQKVTVPDVAGMSQADAGATLADTGLKLVVTGRASSSTVATDSVVSEDPAAGALVRSGSEVGVVLSTGGPSVSVPSVTGSDLKTASDRLAAAGLAVGEVTRQNSQTFPADTVMAQTPAAGTVAGTGSRVDLVVSAGMRTVTMPDVRGISQAAAKTKLANLGLTVDVGKAFSSRPVGTVVSQSPAPGSSVPASGTVTISVSQGQAPVVVPNVKGATAADARSSLTSFGLVPVTVETSGTPSQVGRVISQKPAAGASVAFGSQVRITVGK